MFRIYIIAALASAVSAHSWIECTNHDNSQMLGWMEGNSTLNPPVVIDPEMPWYAYQCTGWPRAKANPGNWIDESSNYIWNIGANTWNGGAYHPPDTHACHPLQRTATYEANAPMVTSTAGGMIRLRFGGNGHTRGQPQGEIGTVSVYWKGAPEQEITDISEFTKANLLQSAGFAADSFSYPADPNIVSPSQGLVDKGNWLQLNLPTTMAPGRHMMVWVWSYHGAPQWSTCFDVMIAGSAASQPAAAAASIKPQAQVQAPVANLAEAQPAAFGALVAAPTSPAAAAATTNSGCTPRYRPRNVA